jgi:hypothetical protein
VTANIALLRTRIRSPFNSKTAGFWRKTRQVYERRKPKVKDALECPNHLPILKLDTIFADLASEQ